MGLPSPESVPLGHLRLHQYLALEPGPRLLVTAAVHGNEHCGARALSRLVDELDTGALILRRGQLTLLPIANPLAWQRRQRQGERNLNRRLMPAPQPRSYEDRVGNVLCPLLAAHEVLLDLHSFQGEGEPFVMLGPRDNQGPLEPFAHAQAEARLARSLGAPRIVEGWMRCYARALARRGLDEAAMAQAIDQAIGTTEAMRRAGGYGVTLECGQHADPTAAYGSQDFKDLKRTTMLGGYQTSGKTDGDRVVASVRVGADFSSGAVRFTPFAGVRYAKAKLDGYTEKDVAGLNFVFDGQSAKSF
ncbi:MAG TPA: autotransporter domain-containing protein, partial [Burkholderiaceae bacterium]|nr:autotransporter domain-containing protein [Burkholderiaceae bacterium]